MVTSYLVWAMLAIVFSERNNMVNPVKKLKVMPIFGTRPEAIKMAPVIAALKRFSDIETVVTVTAQHRQMLDQVLEIFDIHPTHDLDIMQDKQTLSVITSRALLGLEEVIAAEKPDIILVHGDTTTTFSASLAAFYQQVKVGHVEAGLRTYQKYSPFPEEVNRQMTSVLTDIHFAPTQQAHDNLISENIPADNVYITGNTVIDALETTVTEEYHHPVLTELNGAPYILLTTHRRENLGEPMQRIFRAVQGILTAREDVHIVFPIHLNPVIRQMAEEILGDNKRVHLIKPLDVFDFHNLAYRSKLIMTDSGGVQEEAPSLDVPVLVLRDTTERPEGIEAGTLKLVGTDEALILSEALHLLNDEEAYSKMATIQNPYGDGKASERIVEIIRYEFGQQSEKPQAFL